MASVAPACAQAIKDANARWPSRKKASDGILGDARHQKTKSDHNLGNAFDLTHDPDSGCDGNVIAAAAILDSRVKYVIWNRKIFNRERGDTAFRPYTGSNPHTKHCHVSILASARADSRPWAWAPEGGNLATAVSTAGEGATAGAGAAEQKVGVKAPKVGVKPPKTGGGSTTPADSRAYPGVLLKRGARGELVRLVQQRLRALGWEVDVDGIFGQDTDSVVRAFQRRRGLLVDGEVGRRTWTALFG